MVERLKALAKKPWIAHLLRAADRFLGRLGFQFGAAVTYFSVLALVPLVMLAFSVTGFILVEVRPELLDALLSSIRDALGGSAQSTKAQVLALVENALRNYTSIGIFGLLSALYSGAGWMGNLKNAVRAQWRANFDTDLKQENIVVWTLVNLATLLGLILLVGITFGLASVSTSLSDTIVSWLGLDQVTWLSPLLKIVPVVVSVGAGWLLFMYLYAVLPDTRAPWPAIRRGALMGSVGLALLQYLTTFLVGQFGGNAAAALFGPVITLMLFFNLFALLILFIAAWIATTDAPAFPAKSPEEKVRFPLTPEAETEVDDGRVPKEVAVNSVRVGMGAGYVTGTATGVGLGAVIALALSAFRRRHGRE